MVYCGKNLDETEDELKDLQSDIKDLDKAVAEHKESVKTMKDEIQALTTGINDLDKQVAEATKQRKEEHAEYEESMASDGAAKELLGMAKNRLAQFYTPKLAKPDPKRELSEEERITVNMGGTLAPTAAPGGIAGTGVIALIDLMIGDLTKEMTMAEATEKDAQADYEQAMTDAAEKRAADTKTLADKTKAKAETQASMEANGEEKTATKKTLMATLEHI